MMSSIDPISSVGNVINIMHTKNASADTIDNTDVDDTDDVADDTADDDSTDDNATNDEDTPSSALDDLMPSSSNPFNMSIAQQSQMQHQMAMSAIITQSQVSSVDMSSILEGQSAANQMRVISESVNATLEQKNKYVSDRVNGTTDDTTDTTDTTDTDTDTDTTDDIDDTDSHVVPK